MHKHLRAGFAAITLLGGMAWAQPTEAPTENSSPVVSETPAAEQTPAPDPSPAPSETPNPAETPGPKPGAGQPSSANPTRGSFGGPTQGVFTTGQDQGFGLGSVLPDPSVFEGAMRTEPVLQGSRYISNLAITGHYGHYFNDNVRVMLTAGVGRSMGALDADISWKFDKESDGYFSAYYGTTQSHTSSFLEGSPELGLRRNNSEPWVYRTGTGLAYTHNITDEFTVTGGALYQRLTIHDGLFSGRERPLDILGNPLLVNTFGRQDEIVSFRAAGLYIDTDRAQFPTEGTKLRFFAEKSIPMGRSDIDMTRLAINYAQFIPITPQQDTLVFNVQAGTILGDAPPYETWNLGGTNSVRGWDLGELGGGKSFVQATLEYRHALGDVRIFGTDVPLRFVSFVDYGSSLGTANSVIGRPAVVRNKPDSGFGYGVGLQGVTDFGLVRIETAFGTGGRFAFIFNVGDRF